MKLIKSVLGALVLGSALIATSFPESFCGMGASALGSYKLAK